MTENLRNDGFSTYFINKLHPRWENSTYRYSTTNMWNVNLSIGNVNNNNSYNRNFIVGSSESILNIDEWFIAEKRFFKNKHNSYGAQRIHLHPFRVVKLVKRITKKTYKPRPGYCFPIFEPSPREIFAAFCEDRMVHHYVSPFISFIADCVHNDNGDVSHGNRCGHSAQTGAEQIRDYVLKCDPEKFSFVKIDIKSCFPSINREKAWLFFEKMARTYYHESDLEEKLSICKILILHDPVFGCVQLSDAKLWEKVPPRKRMKNSNPGCGLPIGNFYSQLIANIFLAILDCALKPYGVNPRFVDDKCNIIHKSKIKECLEVANRTANEMGLELHPDKIYIQPIYHGVNFCGRTIKGKRIYISSRILNRINYKIKIGDISKDSAIKMCSTVNSYLGLMKHCTERKNEKRIADKVLHKYGKWLYFTVKDGHFTCHVRKKYLSRVYRKSMFDHFNKIVNETWENYKR